MPYNIYKLDRLFLLHNNSTFSLTKVAMRLKQLWASVGTKVSDDFNPSMKGCGLKQIFYLLNFLLENMDFNFYISM